MAFASRLRAVAKESGMKREFAPLSRREYGDFHSFKEVKNRVKPPTAFLTYSIFPCPLGVTRRLPKAMMDKQSESVGLGKAIRNFYAHYGIFTGRSGRSEYWYLWLYSLLLYFALAIPLSFVPSLNAQVAAVTTLPLLILLAHLVPSLVLTSRRLRDAGFSPYLRLLYLAPFGGLVLAILAFLETKPVSTTETNAGFQ